MSAENIRAADQTGRALRRTSVLGVPVDAAAAFPAVLALTRTRLAAGGPWLVTFVNPFSVEVARHRPDYADHLHQFDAVLPDGIGMSVAVRVLHGIPAARVSFDTTSLAPEVLALAAAQGRSVVFVGGRPGCCELAAARLRAVFPGLRIVGCFDGYGELEAKADEIAALRPDIVVCGMGAGPQEQLLLTLSRKGWRGCGFTCGGYFDQLGEGFAYYPAWIDRLDLRWAYRLAREPRRLWRRYCLGYPRFVAALIRALPGSRWRNRRGAAGRPGARTDLARALDTPDTRSRTGAAD